MVATYTSKLESQKLAMIYNTRNTWPTQNRSKPPYAVCTWTDNTLYLLTNNTSYLLTDNILPY